MRYKIPLIPVLIGAAIGYFILSPLSMYISHLVHLEIPVSTMKISDVFKTDLFLWSSSFSVLGSGIGLIIGLLYRSVTTQTEKIVESRNYIELLLDSMHEGMLVIDREYRIIRVNRTYLDQVGEEKEADVVGRNCYDVSHKLEKPCYEAGEDCPVKKVFETGNPATAVHTHLDREKRKIYVELSAYPIKDKSGNVLQAIEISRDITERKMLQDQLYLAQKMESIGRLAGGIAHDFNNLLTSIIGYSEMSLTHLPEEHPVRKNLTVIMSAGENAAALTKQLLAFSRKQVLEMKIINLNKTVEHMAKMLGRIIGEDVILELNIQSQIRNVKADAVQIEQILMNLAVNARDAMPGGGRLIIETADVYLDEEYVKSHGNVIPGSFVMLAVTDTGEGMSQTVQAKIFEPFFTTKEVGKGTGLGLATVYGIVKQHHGYIWIYSEQGKGTTFKIYLPSAEGKEERTAAHKHGGVRRGTESVLVVEDEPSIRRLIVNTLQELGYHVLEAAHAEEALNLINKIEKPLDLLLVDVVLPGMSGIDLVKQLKTSQPDTKVIFMSGYTDNAVVLNNFCEPGTAFLQKPFTPNTLADQIRDVLER